MRIVRAVLLFVVMMMTLLGAVFYVLANHSMTQIPLTCSGIWEVGPENLQGRSETVAAVIEELRPWIVWTNSEGSIRAESKDFPLLVYAAHLQTIGSPPLTLYQFRHVEGGTMIGGYRRSFRELTLEFGEGLVFSGLCEPRDEIS